MDYGKLFDSVGKPLMVGILSVSSYAYGAQVKLDNLSQSVAELSYTIRQFNIRLDDVEHAINKRNAENEMVGKTT